MLKEALEYLAGLGRANAAPVKIDENSRQARYAINGRIETLDRVPNDRDHEPADLAALIALATRFVDQPPDDGPVTPVVWYDHQAVTLVLDDAGHRVETATLSLEESDVFKVIRSLREQKRWLEQKPFIRLLRIDLARTLDPVMLLDKVRRVKFDNGVATTGEITRNRESLGREITSKVEAGGEIPEEVTLSVPVYKTQGETDRYPLRCTVEVDPAQGAFQLLPLPDEIERVVQMAVASIADRLAALPESVPSYYGKP